jgi:hypothetical protein
MLEQVRRPNLQIEDLVLFGKGVRISPRTECEFNRAPRADGGEAVIFAFDTNTDLKNAILIPRSDGTHFEWGNGVEPSDKLALVSNDGDKSNMWRLGSKVRGYSVMWPQNYKVCSTPAGSAWPFGLHDDKGGIIIVRGPWTGAGNVPSPDKLVRPDQEIVSRGGTKQTYWVEVEYPHKGDLLRQTHAYGIVGGETVTIVTSQYFAAHSDGKREEAVRIAHSTASMVGA